MALSAQLTKISLNSTKVPTGATDPGGVNLSSSEPTYENLKLSITKSVVENATKGTTFDNIRTDVTIGIEKQIADKLTAEIENTINTVTYNIDWKNIEQNQNFSSEFYSNVAVNYIATVDVYINIS